MLPDNLVLKRNPFVSGFQSSDFCCSLPYLYKHNTILNPGLAMKEANQLKNSCFPGGTFVLRSSQDLVSML